MAQLQRLMIVPEQRIQEAIMLTPEQQHYLTRVIRLKPGERFIALLESSRWIAELQTDQTARLIEVLQDQTELNQPIILCAALMKGQGFDEVVRSATELGISQLVPILSHRTVVNPSDQKLERWRRIAAEAAEQSQRQVVPQIAAPVSFKQAITLNLFQSISPSTVHRLICVTDVAAPNLLKTLEKLPNLGILIMVGPEGGWTPAEQTMAIAHEFMPVSLGRRVLRAVTASIAVVSVLATYADAAD